MPDPLTISLDRGTRGLLAVLTVLLAVLIAELWWIGPAIVPAASAQIPNAGTQRNLLVEEQKRTNELLARIARRLDEGPVRVQMDPPRRGP